MSDLNWLSVGTSFQNTVVEEISGNHSANNRTNNQFESCVIDKDAQNKKQKKIKRESKSKSLRKISKHKKKHHKHRTTKLRQKTIVKDDSDEFRDGDDSNQSSPCFSESDSSSESNESNRKLQGASNQSFMVNRYANVNFEPANIDAGLRRDLRSIDGAVKWTNNSTFELQQMRKKFNEESEVWSDGLYRKDIPKYEVYEPDFMKIGENISECSHFNEFRKLRLVKYNDIINKYKNKHSYHSNSVVTTGGGRMISSDILTQRAHTLPSGAVERTPEKREVVSGRYFQSNRYQSNTRQHSKHLSSTGNTRHMKRLHTQAFIELKSKKLASKGSNHVSNAEISRTKVIGIGNASMIPLPLCSDEDVVMMDGVDYPLYDLDTIADTEPMSTLGMGIDRKESNTLTDAYFYIKSDKDVAESRFAAINQGLSSLVREHLTSNTCSRCIDIVPWLLLSQTQVELVSLQSGDNMVETDNYCHPSHWNKAIMDRRTAIFQEAIRKSVEFIENNEVFSNNPFQRGMVEYSNKDALGRLYISLIENLNVHHHGTVLVTNALEEACKVLPLHRELRLMRIAHMKNSLDASVETMRHVYIQEIQHLIGSYSAICNHSNSQWSPNSWMSGVSERDLIQCEAVKILVLKNHLMDIELPSGHTELVIAVIQAILEVNVTLGVLLGHKAYTYGDFERHYLSVANSYEVFWEDETSRLGDLDSEKEVGRDSLKGDLCCSKLGFYYHLFREHGSDSTIGGDLESTPVIATTTVTVSDLVQQILKVQAAEKLTLDSKLSNSPCHPFDPLPTPVNTTPCANVQQIEKSEEHHPPESKEIVMQYSHIHGYKVAVDCKENTSLRYQGILKSLKSDNYVNVPSLTSVPELKFNRRPAELHGHDGADEYSSVTKDRSLWDSYYTFGKVESSLSQLQWRPLKGNLDSDGDAMMEQPERVILYADIKPFLFPLYHCQSREMLILEMLETCGLQYRHVDISETLLEVWSEILDVDTIRARDVKHEASCDPISSLPCPIECVPLFGPSTNSMGSGCRASSELLKHHKDVYLFAYRSWYQGMDWTGQQEQKSSKDDSISSIGTQANSTPNKNVNAMNVPDNGTTSKLDFCIRVLEELVEIYLHSHSAIRAGSNYEVMSRSFVRVMLLGLVTLQAQRLWVNKYVLFQIRKDAMLGTTGDATMCSTMPIELDTFLNKWEEQYLVLYEGKCRHYLQQSERVDSLRLIDRHIPPPPVYTGPKPSCVAPEVVSSDQEGKPPTNCPNRVTPAPLNLSVLAHFINVEAALGRYASSTKVCKKSIHAIIPQLIQNQDTNPDSHLLIPGYLELFQSFLHLIILPGVSHGTANPAAMSTSKLSELTGMRGIPVGIAGFRGFPMPLDSFPYSTGLEKQQASIEWFHCRLLECREILYCSVYLPTSHIGSSEALNGVIPILSIKTKKLKKSKDKSPTSRAQTLSETLVTNIQHIQAAGLLASKHKVLFATIWEHSVLCQACNNSKLMNVCNQYILLTKMRAWYTLANQFTSNADMFSNECGSASTSHVVNHVGTMFKECHGIYVNAIESMVMVLHRVLIFLSTGELHSEDSVKDMLQKYSMVDMPSLSNRGGIGATDSWIKRVSVDVLLLKYSGYDSWKSLPNYSNGTIGGNGSWRDVTIVNGGERVHYLVDSIRKLYYAHIQFYAVLQIQFAPYNNQRRAVHDTDSDSTTIRGVNLNNSSTSLNHLLNPIVLLQLDKLCQDRYGKDFLRAQALVDFPGDSVLLSVMVSQELGIARCRPLPPLYPMLSRIQVGGRTVSLDPIPLSTPSIMNTKLAGYLNLKTYLMRCSSTVCSSNQFIHARNSDRLSLPRRLLRDSSHYSVNETLALVLVNLIHCHYEHHRKLSMESIGNAVIGSENKLVNNNPSDKPSKIYSQYTLYQSMEDSVFNRSLKILCTVDQHMQQLYPSGLEYGLGGGGKNDCLMLMLLVLYLKSRLCNHHYMQFNRCLMKNSIQSRSPIASTLAGGVSKSTTGNPRELQSLQKQLATSLNTFKTYLNPLLLTDPFNKRLCYYICEASDGKHSIDNKHNGVILYHDMECLKDMMASVQQKGVYLRVPLG